MDRVLPGWHYISILVIIAVLAHISHARNDIWKNEFTLWKDVVLKSPQKIVPRINLGNAFIRLGALDRAEREFLAALAMNKSDARIHSGLGVIYYQMGLLDKAVMQFELIKAGNPAFPPGRNNLGTAYLDKGRLDDAIEEFSAAIRLDPQYADAYANLGLANKRKGRLVQARQELEKALELSPGHTAARKHHEEVVRLLNAAP